MILGRFCRFLAGRYGLISVSATLAASVIVGLVVGVAADSAGSPPPFKGTLQSFAPAQPPKPAPEIAFTDMAEKPDRKSTRLNSSHSQQSRMPSSA